MRTAYNDLSYNEHPVATTRFIYIEITYINVQTLQRTPICDEQSLLHLSTVVPVCLKLDFKYPRKCAINRVKKWSKFAQLSKYRRIGWNCPRDVLELNQSANIVP